IQLAPVNSPPKQRESPDGYDKETILPPISGSFGTRGDGRRLSLNRVENIGYLTLSRKTVNLEFLGCVENPTLLDTTVCHSFRVTYGPVVAGGSDLQSVTTSISRSLD
ncbi:MAG: hypothetical protein N2C12_00825, partial [Planctomycetales bacterium]